MIGLLIESYIKLVIIADFLNPQKKKKRKYKGVVACDTSHVNTSGVRKLQKKFNVYVFNLKQRISIKPYKKQNS